MAFITHSLKKWLSLLARQGGAVFFALALSTSALAQNTVVANEFRLERVADEVFLSTQLQFELPSVVEDALIKGVPIYFLAEAETLQVRWYWWNRRATIAQRHMRIAFQPLTRRWRLNTSSGLGSDASQGIALNQSFESLDQVLATVKRITNWKIADVSALDPALTHRIEFRFRLDLTQLPRPFQIGAVGQSGWELATSMDAPLPTETTK